MIKKTFLVILLILSALEGIAHLDINSAEDLKITSPLIYKLSSSNNTSLLLGTDHSIPLNCFEEKVKTEILSCDILVREHIAQALSSDYLQKNKGFRDEMSPFQHELINEGLLKRLREQFEDEELEIYSEWFTCYLFDPFYSDSTNLNQIYDLGMDEQISNIYEQNGKEILVLESIEEIIEATKAKESTFSELYDFLKKPLSVDYSFEENKDFLCGNIDELEKNMFESDSLKIRNNLFCNRVCAFMKDHSDKKMLFKVGVDHLIGQTGLLKILPTLGVSVERLTF